MPGKNGCCIWGGTNFLQIKIEGIKRKKEKNKRTQILQSGFNQQPVQAPLYQN